MSIILENEKREKKVYSERKGNQDTELTLKKVQNLSISQKSPRRSLSLEGGGKRVTLVHPTLYLARDVRVNSPSDPFPLGEGGLRGISRLAMIEGEFTMNKEKQLFNNVKPLYEEAMAELERGNSDPGA